MVMMLTIPLACSPSSSSSVARCSVSPPTCAASGKGFGEALSIKAQVNSKEKSNHSNNNNGPSPLVLKTKGFGAPVIQTKKKKKKNGKDVSKESGGGESESVDEEASICPCGGGERKLSYGECCLPYHKGMEIAPDALTLMKARFSAYARGVVSYIVESTHPDNPDFRDDLEENARATCNQLKFYNLDIMDYQIINENEATVSFHAVYGPSKGGRGERKVLAERSYFVREGEKWLFRDGKALSQASQAEWMLSAKSIG